MSHQDHLHHNHSPSSHNHSSPSKLSSFDTKYIVMAASIVTAALIVGGSIVYYATTLKQSGENRLISQDDNSITQAVDDDVSVPLSDIVPPGGVELPIVWGDLGKRLVEVGIIDYDKFISLYDRRGGLRADDKKLLTESNNGRLKITSENASYILNLAWAFGLANNNLILTEGPMMDERYGGAGRFASTGGWTLAQGKTMDHYAKHELVKLTPQQQSLVERVAKGIYRPCCGNSTYFPDCNHGMAMLGLLQLMAAQGVSEDDMYRYALALNSYWFPSTYATIAKSFKQEGINWQEVDPKLVLSAKYSSASGYRQVVNKTSPVRINSGGGCGV